VKREKGNEKGEKENKKRGMPYLFGAPTLSYSLQPRITILVATGGSPWIINAHLTQSAIGAAHPTHALHPKKDKPIYG